MDLSSITTHAQRLSARIAENISERSKDLGLDAEYNAAISPGSTGINQKLPKIAQGILNNSRLWDRHLEISSVNGEIETKKLLGSKHENERLEGLKRVLVVFNVQEEIGSILFSIRFQLFTFACSSRLS